MAEFVLEEKKPKKPTIGQLIERSLETMANTCSPTNLRFKHYCETTMMVEPQSKASKIVASKIDLSSNSVFSF